MIQCGGVKISVTVNQCGCVPVKKYSVIMIQCSGVKGIVDPAILFSPPFTDIDTSGINGVFDHDGSAKLIALVEEINQTAEVA